MPIKSYLLIGAFSLILGGCTLSNSTPAPLPTQPASSSVSTSSANSSVTVYTTAQVATHNSPSSCWLIINAKVYDVTQFVPNHPGGDQILTGCGKDMTQFITTQHQPIDDRLPQFFIGNLQN